MADQKTPDTRLRGCDASDAVCHNLLWEAICTSPSIFCRLLKISRLKEQTTGCYSHHSGAGCDPETVGRVLRQLHLEIFTAWLSLNLRQQERDVQIWLRTSGTKAKLTEVLQNAGLALRQLVPPQQRGPEAELFLQDFTLTADLILRSDNELFEVKRTFSTYELDKPAATVTPKSGWLQRMARWGRP